MAVSKLAAVAVAMEVAKGSLCFNACWQSDPAIATNLKTVFLDLAMVYVYVQLYVSITLHDISFRFTLCIMSLSFQKISYSYF